jgi:glycosyltransferase involved in cell wall biosynthesis
MSSTIGKRLSPPLVSVIITNYNYGRFLQGAIDSILAQTYPDIECIIVDDASTDESPAILAEIADTHSTVKIIRRSVNGGQLAASLDGFAASTGDYVLFLDSDDFLLDQCIATHVFVNLSLRRPVGFTCGDMVEVVGNRLVVGSHSSMSDYICSTAPKAPAVRPISEALAGSWISAGLDPAVLHRLHSIDMAYRGWPWSATSGFFFRRDALKFWTATPGLAEVRRSTDGFFGRAVNALTGSVIIDQPLSAWRCHGANRFFRQPHLGELLNYDPRDELEFVHRRMLLEEVMRDPARFPFNDRSRLRILLETLDAPDPTPHAPEWARASRLSYLLVQNYVPLAQVLGEDEVVAWMRRRRIPRKVRRDAHGLAVPPNQIASPPDFACRTKATHKIGRTIASLWRK